MNAMTRRWRRLTVAALLLSITLFSPRSPAEPITLEQARALALKNNHSLQSIQAKLDAARGDVKEANAFLFNNPELNGDVGRRRITEGSESGNAGDWGIGISQRFELFGQRGARRDAASRALEATEQEIEEARRTLYAEVERRFVEVLSLQTRIEIGQRSLALIEDTASVVRKRVAAGEDSRLDGNLATVEAERARNEHAMLQEQLIQARAALGVVLQTSHSTLPEAVGSLDPRPAIYTLEQLLAAADQRPGLRALDLREQAAKRRLDLERAARYPDVTLGVVQSKEGALHGRDMITSFGFSIPLPLFKRNDAGIGRAVTELSQASVERTAGLRNTRADVLALWERQEKLKMRVARLQESVLPRLEENLKLSQRSLATGAIGLAPWLLAQRQVLEAQREMVDARTALRLGQVELESAAGIFSEPTASSEPSNVQ